MFTKIFTNFSVVVCVCLYIYPLYTHTHIQQTKVQIMVQSKNGATKNKYRMMNETCLYTQGR